MSFSNSNKFKSFAIVAADKQMRAQAMTAKFLQSSEKANYFKINKLKIKKYFYPICC